MLINLKYGIYPTDVQPLHIVWLQQLLVENALDENIVVDTLEVPDEVDDVNDTDAVDENEGGELGITIKFVF